MQAHGGIMSVTGVDGGEPVRVGVSIVDQGAGMWAAMGILAALNRRHATGEGSHVVVLAVRDRDRLDGAAHRRLSLRRSDAPSARLGRHRNRAASGVPDRRRLHHGGGRQRQFVPRAVRRDRTRATSSDERFATNSKRVENRRILIPMLEDVFRQKPSADWQARLDAAGVPAAPIENVAQVVASKQTEALGILQKDPQTGMTLTGLPLEFDGKRPPYRRSAPALGEHNGLLSEPAPKKAAS